MNGGTPSGHAVLLIANYGAELIACAGALALNAQAGGRSHAVMLLARPQARADLKRAASVLGSTVEFADLPYGGIDLSYEQKKRLVKTIREFGPEIVIMQDPEHAWHDLDPDRRMGMMLTLEALALAGRDFAPDDLSSLPLVPLPTLYHLWPENPNCVVDIGRVWELKEEALACISYQHAFTAEHLERSIEPGELERAVPGYRRTDPAAARGLALHRAMERATALHHGLAGHTRFPLVEVFRREGPFPLAHLVP